MEKWFRIDAVKRRVMTSNLVIYVQAESVKAARDAVLAGDFSERYADEQFDRDDDDREALRVDNVVEDDDAMCGPCADCGAWCHLTEDVGGCDCALKEDNDDSIEERLARRRARGEDV